MVFLQLAVNSSSSHVRRATIAALNYISAKQPQLVNRVVRESLTAFLLRIKHSSTKTPIASEEEEESPTHKQARLSAFLFSAAAIDEEIDLTVRESAIAELVVLGHHPIICKFLSNYH